MSRRPRRRRFVSRRAQEAIELLTPRQIASRLGWSDDYADERLKRIVFSAERQHKVEIFVRGGSESHPAYFATMAAVRKWIPQLFDRSKLDELALNVRTYIGQIELRVQEQVVDHLSESTEPHLDEIRAQLKAVNKRQNDFDSRLRAIEKRLREPRA